MEKNKYVYLQESFPEKQTTKLAILPIDAQKYVQDKFHTKRPKIQKQTFFFMKPMWVHVWNMQQHFHSTFHQVNQLQ